MPRVGMEPARRAALVEATIGEIGEAGTLDVTVGQIARRAGMSSALAHHYFGGKSDIFLAAMRHILTEYSAEVRAALRRTTVPEARLRALIAANFAQSFFAPATVAAWLNFYVLAQRDDQAARLLRIYKRRLRSNLIAALRLHVADPAPVADTLGALIDGMYLRAALDGRPLGADAVEQVMDCAEALIGGRE
ncbi:choline-responsive transcriptional repressor BetI [Thalassococcus sp. BH17M4-6]|uniref:choline-binding transcriptional repressor BetI n=1 Tax=Thalassococcus sp. BH17M4-6 TaxID=3413148 RepID=UPI003BD8B978